MSKANIHNYRFSDDPSTRQRTEFFTCAKDGFRMDLFNMRLENIQAAVLVGNLCGVEGQPELESLFFGTSPALTWGPVPC